MPIIFENPNADEAIARIVFDRDLFTIFYRRLTCGAGALEGKEFLDIIKAEVSELENYNPVIIELHSESRHRHFKIRDTELSHVHLGFNQSIEKLKSIKLLVQVIDKLQSNFEEAWKKTKIISDKTFGQSVCATALFSEQTKLLKTTQNFLEQNKSFLTNPATCFWVKSNEPVQQIECDMLPDNIPTYQAILITMRAIMAATVAQQLHATQDKIDSEKPSSHENTQMIFILTCMLGLLISAVLIPPVMRKVRRMF